MEGQFKPFNIHNSSETERLELALESAGIGTWELNPDSNQIYWCHRAANLFSFSGENIVDFETLLSQIHYEDRSIFRNEISRAIHDTLPVSFSLELRTHTSLSGKLRWLLCKGQSHRDTATSTVRLLGTFVEITKDVESRSYKNERDVRNFRTVIEQAPMAIGVLSGPDLVIELGNNKIFEVWGKSPSVTGMRLADVLPETEDHGFLRIIKQVYQTGDPYIVNGLLVRLHRNGIFQDTFFDFVFTPMFNETGVVTGVLEMGIEVTRQHNALRAVEASEAKFRALIDQAPVATCLFTGKEMIVELANQPMIDYWGKDRNVIGKPLREVLPELVGQPFLDILDEILATGIAYSSKNAAVDIEVGGKLSTYYFSFTYKPIFDGNGQIYGIINMAVDVTAQVLAQKALEESESKLRTVVASAPAGIALFVGRELTVELPNQTFIEIMGKGPDIAGQPLRNVISGVENQDLLRVLDHVFSSGVPHQDFGTPVYIFRDGVMNRHYYDFNYSPIYDNDGMVYAILAIATDVTERIHVAKQVEESRLQLLSLFEQSPVGIAIIHKSGFTFTMANPFFCQLVGKKPEEIIDKSLAEVLPATAGEDFEKLLQKVTATGIPFSSKEQAVDMIYDHIRRRVYLDLTCQPLKAPDGEILGVLVVATDLTEQVLSRQRLEQAEISLRGAIDLAELGTYSIDLNTGVLNLSDRLKHWFGVENADIITLEMVYDAICESDLPAVVDAVNEAITPGSNGIYDMEYTMDAKKTGSARILHAQGKVVYDKNGKPVAMIGTAQDVTIQRKIKLALELQVQERTEELEAMNEELSAINEEYIATNEELSDSNNLLIQSNINLEQFAYVASHDLQEPLRKIQAFSELLHKRYGDKLGEGVNYLNRMQAASKRMSELIHDLLAFSRITTKKEMAGHVSLQKIVDEVLNDLELAIMESSAQVHIGSLPEIQGDPIQMNQLFLNLISNAIKFRKPGINPVINISSEVIRNSDLPSSVTVTRTAGTYFRIDVSDNGIGFDQQYAGRIFQLFQRLHGRSEYSGTGIGLAICERVAASHGGGISVLSHPGQGATFSVFLPQLQLDGME